MPLVSDCSLLTMQAKNPAPDLRRSTKEPAHMEAAGSSSITSSSETSVSETSSSDGAGSLLWNDIDRLSSMSNNSRVLAKKKDRRTVRGPLATLRTDTSEPRDVDSDARFTDWDGESYVYEPNGSFVGTMFDDGRSEIAPEDSISVKNVHRRPYEAVSNGECSDDESVYLGERVYKGTNYEDTLMLFAADTSRKTKNEDRLTRLGYVERLPDIDGKRHYRIELAIDKLIEEDKVRTELGTITLSSSELTMLNSDGLQPKLASDLDSPEAFNNGFLEVKSSPVSGYGAFAVHDLEPCTTILIERELFNANAFDLYMKLDALTEEQVKAYHTLYGHRRSPSEDIRAAIWRTNRFSVGRGGSVFLIASRFNHACKGRNNVDYSYDKAKKCMVFATKEKVTAGSELFIRYGSNPQHLFSTWGFRCSCGGCAGISEEECKAIMRSSLGQGQDDSLVSSY
ncbi:hypothetical protein FHL15_004039 [Xylaria flabelliformis]|uniref:SET domain-containing protein n=1 Tax=Xylaria flabelliformis TaxID=2512241 RepID=A0A553I425_9PEZI|nr:hypothetical protein FHL15_004039 [Xylaria flabelliformis]